MQRTRLPQVTVAAFLAAVRAGSLAEGPRAELVDGRARPGRSPSPKEAAVLAHLSAQLRDDAVVSAGFLAMHAAPLRLGPWDLLRADVAVFPASAQGREPHLGVGGSYEPASAVLVAEVVMGREAHEVRAPLYAAAGVRELWLLDVVRGYTEVLRAPWRGLYRSRTLWYPGEPVTAMSMGVEVVPLPAP